MKNSLLLLIASCSFIVPSVWADTLPTAAFDVAWRPEILKPDRDVPQNIELVITAPTGLSAGDVALKLPAVMHLVDGPGVYSFPAIPPGESILLDWTLEIDGAANVPVLAMIDGKIYPLEVGTTAEVPKPAPPPLPVTSPSPVAELTPPPIPIPGMDPVQMKPAEPEPSEPVPEQPAPPRLKEFLTLTKREPPPAPQETSKVEPKNPLPVKSAPTNENETPG